MGAEIFKFFILKVYGDISGGRVFFAVTELFVIFKLPVEVATSADWPLESSKTFIVVPAATGNSASLTALICLLSELVWK